MFLFLFFLFFLRRAVAFEYSCRNYDDFHNVPKSRENCYDFGDDGGDFAQAVYGCVLYCGLESEFLYLYVFACMIWSKIVSLVVVGL